MAKEIRMEGAQALSFVSIHPVKCGIYFLKVKQMASWAKYWDELQDVTNDGNNKIGCTEPVTSLNDCKWFMESLTAHIFDGCRELELVVNDQMFEVKKLQGEEGGYSLKYYIFNGTSWINQCRYGYIFKGMYIIGLLEILYERMLSDNWGNFPSEYINY